MPAPSVRVPGPNETARCIALAAVLLATLTACTAASMPVPSLTPTPTVAAPIGDGVLRIGTIIPTSGTFSFLGPAQVAGVQLAVRELNEAGGFNGVPVEVLARDSGDAAAQTAEASFADLVNNGVDVVIGPTSSAIAQRLVPLALDARVPLISPAATYPALTEVRDAGYVFRTIPAYGHQGLALARELAGKRVAVIAVDDDLGRSLVETLDAGLSAEGGELVLREMIPASTTDLSVTMQALKDAAPDAVVLASAYSTFDLTKALIAQTLAAGFGAGKLWLTTQNTGDYNQAFPPGTLAGVNGIIEGAQPDDAFTARLKAVDGNLSAFRYAAEAYDATMLAALAAMVAGDDAGSAIAAALPDVSRGGVKCLTLAECLGVLNVQGDIDYDGVSGPVNFTEAGDVTPAYYGVYAYDGDNKFVLQRGLIVG